MANILQSPEWAQFQQSIGHRVLQAEGPGWRYLATVEGGRTGRYLYCPYGPEAESPDAFDRALADLVARARQERCWFVRVEPVNGHPASGSESAEESLRRRGMRRSPRQVQPGHTQVVDLRKDAKDLLKDMKSTNRNLYRNIHKKGVSIERSQDPQDVRFLLSFLDDTARRRNFNRQQDDYLRAAAESLMPVGAASLYLAKLHGEPIAASLVYDSGDTRTYAHAAMDQEHRRLSAGIPLVVTMIMEAKEKGLTWFDLFGTAPEEAGPEHEWYGFTSFKKSFGGQPVSYPGTWDLPVSRAGYAAYTGARAAREGLSTARTRARELRTRLRERRTAEAAA
ncbi:methicillin resistance protein [Kocuria tytonicola]|uniref:Peptidoglycan bridge formation glycyltransferase FemA/FemB family protein n=1 Tax=Kocuria tytonicola TaxID=2055946 RepID=A0A3L9L0P2_9MICC|nr:peptidoglycan bridge formation glycyltransferase FemA/FemB family protein [Kocuria tytonicola]RLY92250.1 peptidoglycan bridge formation glycyltransferase FemA/FemB family protein [Kocuria tytonicola]RLZ02530.1 methicillin resistance protein [Kocuria tytonicola]